MRKKAKALSALRAFVASLLLLLRCWCLRLRCRSRRRSLGRWLLCRWRTLHLRDRRGVRGLAALLRIIRLPLAEAGLLTRRSVVLLLFAGSITTQAKRL